MIGGQPILVQENGLTRLEGGIQVQFFDARYEFTCKHQAFIALVIQGPNRSGQHLDKGQRRPRKMGPQRLERRATQMHRVAFTLEQP